MVVNPNEFFANVFGYDNLADAREKLKNAKTADVKLCEGVTPAVPLIDGQQLYVERRVAALGWEYGAMVVPFKMQLGGKHAFTGSASVGAYLGYTVPLWDSGLAISPVAFAGASNISVPTDGNKKDNTDTAAG